MTQLVESRLAAASRPIDPRVDLALILAAQEGRVNLMGVARSCGAHDVNKALLAAVGASQREAASLCFEWGATSVNEALHTAVAKGDVSLAELVWTNGIKLFGEVWKIRIIDDALVRAVISDQPDTAEWCLSHGAQAQFLDEVLDHHGSENMRTWRRARNQ